MNNEINEKKIILDVETLDEALKIAAKKFSAPENELKSKIISEGKKGFFGFFSKKMQVEITYTKPEPVPEKTKNQPSKKSENQKSKRKNFNKKIESEHVKIPEPEKVIPATEKTETEIIPENNNLEEKESLLNRSLEFLDSVLNLMDFDCHAELKESSSIEITGDDASDYVVGHYGDALKSLEYIVNLALRDPKKEPRLKLDSCGYRERRVKNLERLAEATARQAVRFGRPVKLDPMASWERWVIHTTLKNRDDVTTESIGEPPLRKVVIMPKFDTSRPNRERYQKRNNFSRGNSRRNNNYKR